MIDATALATLLKKVKPGQWAAVRRDTYGIVATEPTCDAVLAKATERGEPDPIVFRMPESAVPDNAPGINTEPPVYDLIADGIINGEVVPFLGSGASLVGYQEDYDADNSPFIPSASQLTEFLAHIAQFPIEELPQSDLAAVSAYAERKGGRPILRSVLRRALGPLPNKNAPGLPGLPRGVPGPIHGLLAKEENIQLIITTNYDTLIERAFDEAKRKYDVIVYPAESSDFQNGALVQLPGEPLKKVDLTKKQLKDFSDTVIFKMHGSLAPMRTGDSFVITEDDYLRFLSRMADESAVPKMIADPLSRMSLLFLGYGLRDWNLRLLLGQLKSQRLGWAIQQRVKRVDRALWEKRNIDLYECDLGVFSEGLQRALEKRRGGGK
jgi:hypothetical protein